MDAITLLTQDHREVEAWFKRFEKLGDRAEGTRGGIVDKLLEALSRHSVVEEQFLYPALRERTEQKGVALALRSLEEHHVVKWLLHELEGMKPGEERFNAKVQVLTEMVRHHVGEEESEVFPLMRRLYSKEELVDLGTLCEEAKRMAPTRPHPRAPDTPPGNLIAGALSGLIDRGRDLVGELRAPRSGAARRARQKPGTRAKRRRS